MQKIKALLLAIMLVLSVAACEQNDTADLDVETEAPPAPPAMEDPEDAYSQAEDPSPVPSLQMTTMDDEVVSLEDYQGEVVVLNFWATWCGPCRVEVPDLIEMQDNLDNEGLTIVGIAVGEDADQIRPFAEEFGINYLLVPDPGREISDSFDGIYGLPTTIVVNPEGQMVERILGLFSVEEMQGRIETMLAER